MPWENCGAKKDIVDKIPKDDIGNGVYWVTGDEETVSSIPLPEKNEVKIDRKRDA